MDRAEHPPLAPSAIASGAGTGTREPDSGRPAAPAWGSSGGRWLLLALLALMGLRFVRIGEWSLWIDEALTLSDALHGQGQGNPLGYRLFAGWYGLFETRPSEFLMRLPAAVLGALSLGLCAFTFRALCSRRVALASAVLVGASSWHLYWSQNARFYTLAMVLSLAGAGVFLRGLQRDRLLLGLLGLGLCGSAALAHPTSGFLLPGLALAAIVEALIARRPQRPKTPAPESPGAGASPRSLAIACLILALTGVVLELATGSAAERLAEWQGKKRPSGAPHLILSSGFYFTPLLLTGALAGAYLGFQRGSRAVRIAVLVILCNGLIAVFLAERSRMTAQYVFGLLPWVAFLAAYPLERTEGNQGPGTQPPIGAEPLRLAYLLVLLLPALTTCLLQLSVRAGERPRWRDAYRVVFEQRKPDDLVMGMAAAVGEYYLDPDAREVRYPRSVVYLDRDRWPVAERWDRTGRPTWFVVNHEELRDWRKSERDSFERVLREDCRQVARFPLIVESRDLSVFVYYRD